MNGVQKKRILRCLAVELVLRIAHHVIIYLLTRAGPALSRLHGTKMVNSLNSTVREFGQFPLLGLAIVNSRGLLARSLRIWFSEFVSAQSRGVKRKSKWSSTAD